MRANYCNMITLSPSVLKYFLKHLAKNVIESQACQSHFSK